MKKSIFFLLLNCFSTSFVFAQKYNIDSLENVLTTLKSDTNKVKTLFLLCDNLSQLKPEKSIQYGNQGLSLAKDISFKRGVSICLNALGKANQMLGQYDKALECYRERYKVVVEMKDLLGQAGAIDNIGIIYFLKGNADTALQLRKSAIEIYKTLGNDSLIALGLIWIGNIYMSSGNYSQAIENFFQALKEFEKLNDKANSAIAQINISNIYRHEKQYDKAKQFALEAISNSMKIDFKYGLGVSNYRLSLIYVDQKDCDNAIKYLQEARKIFEETSNKYFIGLTEAQLGENFLCKGNYRIALIHFEIALNTALELDTKSLIATSYGDMGIAYKELKNYSKAQEYSRKSEKILWELNDKATLKDLASSFIEIYSRLNKPDSVLKYLNSYQQLSDTLYSEQTSNTIAEMQTKYETEKKDQLIQNQTELITIRNKSIRNRNYFLIILGSLFLVIVALLFRSVSLGKQSKKQLKQIQLLQSELRHRTGGFFNSIKGMLAIAAAHTTDKETVLMLERRVSTVNNLYNTLYSSPSTEQITFPELLNRVCNDFENSFARGKNIRIYSNCKAGISKTEAIPLAYIITELLANAEKYAFENMGSGEIHVDISEAENKRLLHVWDNGSGRDLNFSRPGSQGTGIIKSYAKSLEGEIKMWNDNGFHFQMNF